MQLFVTSHNQEFISEFLQAYAESSDDIGINFYTLREDNCIVRVRTLSAGQVVSYMEKFNFDLR